MNECHNNIFWKQKNMILISNMSYFLLVYLSSSILVNSKFYINHILYLIEGFSFQDILQTYYVSQLST